MKDTRCYALQWVIICLTVTIITGKKKDNYWILSSLYFLDAIERIYELRGLMLSKTVHHSVACELDKNGFFKVYIFAIQNTKIFAHVHKVKFRHQSLCNIATNEGTRNVFTQGEEC